MSGLKRGGAAIVGAAESDLGQVAEGFNVIDLMAQGIARALDDCGLGCATSTASSARATQSRTSGLQLERISRDLAGLYRLDDPRRLVVHVPCRARGGGAPARAVPGRGRSPMARRSAASAGGRPRCARSTRTRRRTGRSCRRPPMRSPPRATCTNSARPASSWPRSRSRRGNGRCSTRPPGRRSR